ncbi:pseudouridine synthase [Virgibacillus oceani]|uniref:Pseudouridine synthase n=1 Tax=Virgibacillus oceani TaxID=1479511 RepID=A0A917M8S1_9BACI|nr:pseudouridine synthase [Virgibacillus oceani]GGG84856.1 pseudouridine synthase [Virgibacillus oceani]
MRLDKLLANMGFGSRKDVKESLKKKYVTVNDNTVKDGSMHIDTATDIVKVLGETIRYQKYVYLMMNKPPGFISATADRSERTVIDIVNKDYQHFNPFPVGRLDKDTEGLLLLTNDGELAHQLTSPKKDVSKTYFAKIDGNVTETDILKFKAGVVLEDGYKAKPAHLCILSAGHTSEVKVTITEGKYHQVKRMFEAVDKKVTHLKRLRMGSLTLDENLEQGGYRELNRQELEYCLSLKDSKKRADI